MKIITLALFIILTCSCAPKMTEGKVYVARKYIGRSQQCIPMRMPINLPNSTIIVCDSIILKVKGIVNIPPDIHCYIRFERPYYVKDCKGMLEAGEQQFMIK